jgi:hypothetical protein
MRHALVATAIGGSLAGITLLASYCLSYFRKSVKREVFLGGSCNPTTWRKEEVIPVLEREKIEYFNPQVDYAAERSTIRFTAQSLIFICIFLPL